MADAADTSERGLERLICTALAGHPCDPPNEGKVAEARPGYGGVGWSGGNPHDYYGRIPDFPEQCVGKDGL